VTATSAPAQKAGPGFTGADPPETSLLFDVFSLNQAVGRLLAETMRAGPLTPTDYAVYSAIFELEAATPTELAARLGMRLTTFVDRLRELERRGHAQRVAHPTDGRSYRVVLTADGLAAHREANQQFERAYAAFEQALGHEDAPARAVLLEVRAAADRARDRVARDAPSLVPASPRRSGGRAG
jgi:DNA-binding MarR family transcriptional regulator